MNKHFDQAPTGWDQDQQRVQMAESIAETMIRKLHLKPDYVAMDYGTGTGIVALKMQPLVRKVVAVDNSKGMLDILKEKLKQKKIANIEVLLGSLGDPPADNMAPSGKML